MRALLIFVAFGFCLLMQTNRTALAAGCGASPASTSPLPYLTHDGSFSIQFACISFEGGVMAVPVGTREILGGCYRVTVTGREAYIVAGPAYNPSGCPVISRLQVSMVGTVAQPGGVMNVPHIRQPDTAPVKPVATHKDGPKPLKPAVVWSVDAVPYVAQASSIRIAPPKTGDAGMK